MSGPRRFQFPWRSRQDIRNDVDDELRFHLETRAQELVASGFSADDARLQAAREFGDIEDARQYMRHVDGSIETRRRQRDYVGELRQDLRYSLRSLKAAPAFTIVAILTLALGIGANSAVFTVVHRVLQAPLPFPNADRLVRVWTAKTDGSFTQASVSAVDLDDWRANRKQIADLGGWWFADGASGMDMTGHGAPARVSAAFVSPGFFSTLQVGAELGRLPRDNEMVRGGDDRVVVLAHGYWLRNFGGNSNVINSAVLLNGESYRVVGVMPQTFAFPSPHAEIFVPFSVIPDGATPRIRPVRIMDVVARLKTGVSIGQASAEMKGITRALAAQFPDANAAWGDATVMSLHEAVTGSVKTSLMLLFSAVSFVLLMTCVNVASLLLARASSREREMAVRVSLGATKGRILRQLVTESLVLAMAGGVLGSVFAAALTRGLVLLAAGQLPRAEEIHVDGTTLLFVLGIALVTGVLFGTAPALRSSAVNLRGTLNASSRNTTGGHTRLRSALVVTQIAFAVVLAVGAGLMVRSFDRLLNVNVGFKPDHLLAVNFNINTERHGDTTWQRYYSQVLDRVRATPGVMSAGASQYAPYRGMGERNSFVPLDYVVHAGEDRPSFPTQRVSDGYFRTIGTPLLSGREFLPTDRKGSPPVLIVNEAYAKKFFPEQDVVGKIVSPDGKNPITIVGVVGDIRQSAIARPAEPLMYLSNLQNGRVKVTLVSRTMADPLTMTNAIRNAIWSVDRDQTITSVFTFDDVVNESLARPRMLTILFGIFGTLGIALGGLGIYGVLSFLVSARRRELAVRIALGARASSVITLVLRRGLLLAFAGVVLGLGLALALARFAASQLYDITPTDPLSYGLVTCLLLVIAALASALPAFRASRVAPVTAMQSD
ncbi:MAG: ABC transporter permease [Gemmatimonas sp.]